RWSQSEDLSFIRQCTVYFDGQVLKDGEYIGRIGGMHNFERHIHQEYRDSKGNVLDTNKIVSQFMPDKFQCLNAYCHNPTKIKETKK
ncbi:MAG TPA: hypothetical protein PL048_25575, partial [Leptospiraceae bacterium]|nr:hypothetical protein [Leptospiraceae bacterium]